jgi:aminobenzoyl-glutamate transport protein
MAETRKRRVGILDFVEWVGNKLPDPAMLFVIGALVVMALSHLGQEMGWSVQPVRPQQVLAVDAEGAPIPHASGRPPKPELIPDGAPITVKSLLDRDGFYWAISSMVKNFMAFPPLGIVLTGMLGIGVAERVGLFSAVLRWLGNVVPAKILTPTMIFLGILSSAAMDAGYVVLPPLAAVLYMAVGRSPLVGIAAVFAGVSAGFCANIVPSGIDAMLAGATENAARIVDGEYEVNIMANLWFIMGSAVVLTFVGWGVTARFIEPRLSARAVDEGGPQAISAEEVAAQRLTAAESRALGWAGIALLGFLLVAALLIFIPGAPMYGQINPPENKGQRWVQVMVPVVFFFFLVPGIAYGLSIGTVRSTKDVAKAMIESMAAMAPIIVLAFFAAQFIEYFRESNLGQMLAMAGGQALFAADLRPELLLVLFIGLVMVLNLFVGSMSAKYFLVAPIFVPMFMMAGISPQLTQAAYRVGDSVTNVVTPLNSYLLILLIVMQRYAPRAGIGTMIALMMPYTIVFAIVWTVFLLLWLWLGLDLGPGVTGPLWYPPPAE